ncbi:hypothetical protein MEZE111188_09185 [Mesobacillus zeae]
MSKVWYPSKKSGCWNALDSESCHPTFKDTEVSQKGSQNSETYQSSEETIDSIDSKWKWFLPTLR